MTVVTIQKVNEVYIKVTSEPHVERELYDLFKFHVPQSKFINRQRKSRWDGYIHLYSLKTKQIYYGLLDKIIEWSTENQYQVVNNIDIVPLEISDNHINQFIDSLKLTKQPRDYQLEAFKDCIKSRRRLTLSPTGSGKSLLIYMLARFYLDITDQKVLVIVPTTGLVHQMSDDFISYGFTKNVHRIVSGVTKHTPDRLVVSTWQSLQNIDSDWFDQFQCVLFDEAHLCKAKVLSGILQSLKKCPYRFGFTGTLDGIDVNVLILEGLFNTQNKVISTAELINRKQLADLDIKILVLQYDKQVCKVNKDNTYQQEIEFIISNIARNKFIKNLALSLKGNTLILYDRVEKHGEILFDMIRQQRENTYFIHGGIDGQYRNQVRHNVEQSKDAIIVASFGVFSTGVSIVNLHNIIYASPTKSKIRNLQSIGRGLRVSEEKKAATLYDIADDLSHNNKKNYTLNHLFERVKNYNAEQFPFKVFTIPIQYERTDVIQASVG